MFDLSWVELTFCLALALIVVGPRDLPKLVQLLSGAVRRMRRVSADIRGSMIRLEREIVLSDREQQDASAWQELIPPEIREMRRSIRAHGPDREETARKYRTYKEAAAEARAEYRARQALPPAAEHPN